MEICILMKPIELIMRCMSSSKTAMTINVMQTALLTTQEAAAVIPVLIDKLNQESSPEDAIYFQRY